MTTSFLTSPPFSDKESNMAGKRNEGLVKPYIAPERGVYSDSQSPQSRRGSAQDHEQFGGDRTVSDGITWKTPADGDFHDDSGFRHSDSLHIEDENPTK
jgi:hypothetical protein